jgi:cytochrome P450
VTVINGPGVYYDPYDLDIHADPYPTFRRLRAEAPLYYNDRYDFYALSRFVDVEKGLADHGTFSSARGVILEMIKADLAFPQGVFICEDPPVHSAHRGLLSRVFTPKRMNALEPQIRALCAEVLDPLVGNEGFDFIADLGALMPMRVIGMLLGIPEPDQRAVQAHGHQRTRREPGQPIDFTGNDLADPTFFGDYIDWRCSHPSDDLIPISCRPSSRMRPGSFGA